jgi:hypothetical protein
MELKVSGKFCPVCKNKNPRTASFCNFCGALLEDGSPSTIKDVGGQPDIATGNAGSFIDAALIPEGGIGIYVAGSLKPYYLRMDRDLVIGRAAGGTSETFLDLSDLDAFNLGLSRRHAKIRRTGSGYEVIDLASTNGTWLDNQRLIPNRPYSFGSGSQLRLGRLQLFAIYHTVHAGSRNNSLTT